jgi:hypothetical protein
MTRIAFATYRGNPAVTDDDHLAVQALAERGVQVDAIPWDAPVKWDGYAAVVLRSTWDFHHRLPEFRRWLDHLDDLGVPTFNPLGLLRWNTTKHYLRSLEALGVGIVPTLWVDADEEDSQSLAETATRKGWMNAIVVKPVVSASAHGTWVAHDIRSDADQRRLRDALASSPHGLMLQPFLAEVQEQGEWSLIFLGGCFSHAVLKRPADGDFRVQGEHGGTAVTASPAIHIVDAAARALEAAARCTQLQPDEILYARVDGVMREGRFLLMELEAVEPFLFLGTSTASAARMASQIESAVAAF